MGPQGGCGALGAAEARDTRVCTQGEIPSAGGTQGTSAHPGRCFGCRYGCILMCSWVHSWALQSPLTMFPAVLSFSARLARAVPAHNDMVIVSGGPATRTARLTGQPLRTRVSRCPGGPTIRSPHPPGDPCIRLHLGSAPAAMWGGAPTAGCGHLLAWELGNLPFPWCLHG